MVIELGITVLCDQSGDLWVRNSDNDDVVGRVPKGEEDTVFEVCKFSLDDGEFPIATTYEVVCGLDGLSDEPRVHDLLHAMFLKGFNAGEKRAKEGVRKTLGL